MSNKKQLIQIAVIAACFLAAGLVLYRGGLFGQPQVPPAPITFGNTGFSTSTTASNGQQEILPYGSTLNFNQAVDSSRFDYNQVQYPVLQPNQDVGVNVNSLVMPMPKAAGQ